MGEPPFDCTHGASETTCDIVVFVDPAAPLGERPRVEVSPRLLNTSGFHTRSQRSMTWNTVQCLSSSALSCWALSSRLSLHTPKA